MPVLLSLAAGLMMAQAYDEKVPEYRGPAIQLSAVHGEVEHEGAGGRVTVSVFTDVDHKLVASVTTKKKGHFAFRDLPMGHYRRVAMLVR